MTRTELKDIMDVILTKHSKPPSVGDSQDLRDAGFRSLDFSEMALRVERQSGRELTFDAALMRRIATVGDVLDFFEKSLEKP